MSVFRPYREHISSSFICCFNLLGGGGGYGNDRGGYGNDRGKWFFVFVFRGSARWSAGLESKMPSSFPSVNAVSGSYYELVVPVSSFDT